MKKVICFDMDGSIADLYNVPNWLPLLRAESPIPYLDAVPMWDMAELNSVLLLLKKAGWEIRVITQLSMNSSESYKEVVRDAKIEWLKKWNFPYDHFHGVRYGATKADSVRKYSDYAVLIDDNKKVREGWHLGATIDPTTCDLVQALYQLL